MNLGCPKSLGGQGPKCPEEPHGCAVRRDAGRAAVHSGVLGQPLSHGCTLPPARLSDSVPSLEGSPVHVTG